MHLNNLKAPSSNVLRSVSGRTDSTELKLATQKDLGSHFVNDEKDVTRVTGSKTCHSSNLMRTGELKKDVRTEKT